MPIGPRGERLPYNGNGDSRYSGVEKINSNMGRPMPFNGGGQNRGGVPGGGDVMAAKQRLMQIVAEAESILAQHPSLAQELMGGGGQIPTPVGGVGGMPPMPVAGNTGALGGGGLIA